MGQEVGAGWWNGKPSSLGCAEMKAMCVSVTWRSPDTAGGQHKAQDEGT